MFLDPWTARQLQSSHRADLEAGAPARFLVAPRGARRRGSRGALARHVGDLLVAAGRRLGASDTLPAAGPLALRRRTTG